jgi:hypothetical protein
MAVYFQGVMDSLGAKYGLLFGDSPADALGGGPVCATAFIGRPTEGGCARASPDGNAVGNGAPPGGTSLKDSSFSLKKIVRAVVNSHLWPTTRSAC